MRVAGHILIFFLFLKVSVLAQSLGAQEADIQTYNSFINQDYDKTIHLGKDALRNGIDFYYLRYRIGLSYYEKKNYSASVGHLEKALSMYDADELLKEYLYYAYLLSNQIEKAGLLADQSSPAFRKKVDYNRNLVSSIGVEVGYLFTDNLTKFGKIDLVRNNSFGQANVYSDVMFGNLTFTNQLGSRLRLYHNMSLVSNTSNLLTQINVPSYSESTFTTKNKFYQYNFIASYFLHSFQFSLSSGYYLAHFSDYSVLPLVSPSGAVSYPKAHVSNYSIGLGIKRRLKYFEPAITGNYSDFMQKDNFTTEAGITFYPFGNNKLYGNSKLSYVWNADTSNEIFSQLLGGQVSKHVFLEAFGAIGDHTNYIADNGQMVYYTPNKINWYAGSQVNIFLKKVSFSLGYNLQERESFFVSGSESIPFKYKYNLIKSKVTWNF